MPKPTEPQVLGTQGSVRHWGCLLRHSSDWIAPAIGLPKPAQKLVTAGFEIKSFYRPPAVRRGQ